MGRGSGADRGSEAEFSQEFSVRSLAGVPREIHPWIQGGCYSFALAMCDAAAEDEIELKLGTHTSTQGIEHVFTHDDSLAYDALGQHPLPYRQPGWEDSYEVDPEEIEKTYPVDEEEISRAFEIALSIWPQS